LLFKLRFVNKAFWVALFIFQNPFPPVTWMGTVMREGRFIRLFIVSCLSLSMLSMCAKGDQGEEGTVLVVGSRKVSGAELKEKLNQFMGGLELSGEDWTAMKEDLLQRAIDEYVVLEYGREAGIEVTEQELEGEIRQITTDYGKEDFQEMLLHQYVDFQSWKNKLREQILIRKVLDAITAGAAPPSYEEIKAYYQDHQADFTLPAMVKFRQVVTPTVKEAETVVKALKAGDRFSEVAMRYSTAPEAANGGEVGWVAPGELEASMEKAIFALKIGEISSVVKTPYGYHVFQLMAVRPGGPRPLPEVMAEIETLLSDQRREKIWLTWLVEQRKRFPVSVRSEVFEKMERS
jgi:parvulin-like peptidyl-prolyl isomerase